MWEILKGWRKKNKDGFICEDGSASPLASRNFSASVNFKDLNISLDPTELEEEEEEHLAQHAGPSKETSGGAVARTPTGTTSSTPVAGSPRTMTTKLQRRLERNKLIIIMVGLPGRGKTFLCNKLVCYLNWLGHATKLFNVGMYRRLQNDTQEVQDAAFFDKNNSHGLEARRRALEAALTDLKSYLAEDSEGQVAIFDATNTTKERRQYLIDKFHGKYQYLFIESICNDPQVLEQNYRYKMRYSPDYKGVSEEQALRDFKERIQKYEEVYEPLEDRTRHWIKLIDMVTGRGYLDVNRISGYLPGKLVFFLMQVCKAGMNQERKIWLTRHGESQFNQQGRIGGDSSLSPLGEEYARRLPDVLMSRLPALHLNVQSPVPISVWTSTLRRTIETAEYLMLPKLRWKALDEIHAGSCDGLTYEEISKRYPDEYEARKKDKLKYRYPAGESYLDVIQRLEPVIIELERERECVCIVAHQAVLRAIYGYFMSIPLTDIPTLEIPLHSLIELQPRPDGTMKVEVIEVTMDPGTGLQPSLPPNHHTKHPPDTITPSDGHPTPTPAPAPDTQLPLLQGTPTLPLLDSMQLSDLSSSSNPLLSLEARQALLSSAASNGSNLSFSSIPGAAVGSLSVPVSSPWSIPQHDIPIIQEEGSLSVSLAQSDGGSTRCGSLAGRVASHMTDRSLPSAGGRDGSLLNSGNLSAAAAAGRPVAQDGDAVDDTDPTFLHQGFDTQETVSTGPLHDDLAQGQLASGFNLSSNLSLHVKVPSGVSTPVLGSSLATPSHMHASLGRKSQES